MVELRSSYDNSVLFVKADEILSIVGYSYDKSVITLKSEEKYKVMGTPFKVNELIEKDLHRNDDRLAMLEARVDKLLDVLVEQSRSQAKQEEKSNVLKKPLSSKKKDISKENTDDKGR